MYRKLAIALAINAVVMYFLTYAMLAETAHFHFNVNRAYMALMMVAPMAIVMLLVMRSMYPNRKANYALYAFFGALFVACFAFARTQALVDDGQFLRSMIPHHSTAILVCERASITDPEIERLCGQIVESQRREIELMTRMLARR